MMAAVGVGQGDYPPFQTRRLAPNSWLLIA